MLLELDAGDSCILVDSSAATLKESHAVTLQWQDLQVPQKQDHSSCMVFAAKL